MAFPPRSGGALTLYDQPSTNGLGIQVWLHSVVNAFSAPTDINNPTDHAINTCQNCIDLAVHTAAFHPGPGGQFGVYRFTAPSAGTYQLNATFGGIDSGGTDVYILDNGSQFYSHNLTLGSNQSFTLSLTWDCMTRSISRLVDTTGVSSTTRLRSMPVLPSRRSPNPRSTR
jgi:hypothetical protein